MNFTNVVINSDASNIRCQQRPLSQAIFKFLIFFAILLHICSCSTHGMLRSRFLKQLLSYILIAVLAANITVEVLHTHNNVPDACGKRTTGLVIKQHISKCFICEYLIVRKESCILTSISAVANFKILICEFTSQGSEKASAGKQITSGSRGPPFPYL